MSRVKGAICSISCLRSSHSGDALYKTTNPSACHSSSPFDSHSGRDPSPHSRTMIALPAELWLKVIANLDERAANRLLSVNRVFYDYAMNNRYRTLDASVSSRDMFVVLPDMCERLRHPEVYQRVRELHVTDALRLYRATTIFSTELQDTHLPKLLEIHPGTLLSPALRHLPMSQRIAQKLAASPLQACYEEVTDRMVALPSLDSLTITLQSNPGHPTSSQYSHSLPNLELLRAIILHTAPQIQHLRITGAIDLFEKLFEPEEAETFLQFPLLKTLEVELYDGAFEESYPIHAFSSFLNSLRESITHLRLKITPSPRRLTPPRGDSGHPTHCARLFPSLASFPRLYSVSMQGSFHGVLQAHPYFLLDFLDRHSETLRTFNMEFQQHWFDTVLREEVTHLSALDLCDTEVGTIQMPSLFHLRGDVYPLLRLDPKTRFLQFLKASGPTLTTLEAVGRHSLDATDVSALLRAILDGGNGITCALQRVHFQLEVLSVAVIEEILAVCPSLQLAQIQWKNVGRSRGWDDSHDLVSEVLFREDVRAKGNALYRRCSAFEFNGPWFAARNDLESTWMSLQELLHLRELNYTHPARSGRCSRLNYSKN